MPEKSGGLNRSMQHWLAVYSPGFAATSTIKEPGQFRTCRVPHLRDGFIVAKVGHRAKHDLGSSRGVFSRESLRHGNENQNSRNGNPSEINPEEVACFSSPKNDRQLTSFHQQSTTNSPSKNHVLHHVFAKTPAKTLVIQPQKNSAKAMGLPPVFQGRWPWVVAEIGVTDGVARPTNSVTELLVKLVTQILPEASMARPRGLLRPAA